MPSNSSWFKKGRIPWNKGLTKETSKKVKQAGIKIGMRLKGRTLSTLAKQRASDSLKLAYATGKIKHWNKKPKIKLICKNCGGGFSVRPYRAKAQFCSKKCYGEWRTKHNNTKVKLVCKGCGKEFFVSPCEKDKRITCSPKCSKRLQWQNPEFVAKQMKARNVCPNKSILFCGLSFLCQ